MIDLAQLRAAFDYGWRDWHFGDSLQGVDLGALDTILDAARELLTIREAGALIITPDEDGKWPEWALKALATGFSAELLDALRDAMPDGET